MNAAVDLSRQRPRRFLVTAAAVWFITCQALVPGSESPAAPLPTDRQSHLGGALQFFLYDTPVP